MIIRDALYGAFELPSFLRRLVTAPEFRRLSEVRLININSPSLSTLAEVRRYSHTLGVVRLALENSLLNFGEDEHRALLASIIVHDAGTPAFAHLFEYQLNEQFSWNHEAIVPDILRKRHHVDAGLHQFYAYRRPEFQELCQASDIDFDIVLAILEGRHPGSTLVFGSIDFDNLDNVARMSWMLGTPVDLKSILRLAGALGADPEVGLLLPSSRREDLLAWAALRRQAYEILVFDGPTVSGQAVLSSLINQALREGVLSVDDWHYTDNQLLKVLEDMSQEAKTRLAKEFNGPLPEMKLLLHLTEVNHPLFDLSRWQINTLISRFLERKRVNRPYGYCLSDRGTFEKQITAVDPSNGLTWSVGKYSHSLILYGFGRGGARSRNPIAVGREFLDWSETADVEIT